MKKHRNFLIFYSLWLAVIFTLLTVFDTSQDIKLPATNRNTICETTSRVSSYDECKKCQRTWCCVSIEGHTAVRLQ